jgi:hypothetical protein
MTSNYKYNPEDYGYDPEEWVLFPEETIADITAIDEEIIDPDDLLIPTSIRDDELRTFHLRNTLHYITEANKRKLKITPEHPDYDKIAQKYNIQEARERGDRYDDRASQELNKACGYCALVNLCPIANDYRTFYEIYRLKKQRDKLERKLEYSDNPC